MVVEWCRIESLDTAWGRSIDHGPSWLIHRIGTELQDQRNTQSIHKVDGGTSQDEYAPLDDQKGTILCIHSRLTFSTRDERSHHTRSVSSSAEPAIGIRLVDVVEE